MKNVSAFLALKVGEGTGHIECCSLQMLEKAQKQPLSLEPPGRMHFVWSLRPCSTQTCVVLLCTDVSLPSLGEFVPAVIENKPTDWTNLNWRAYLNVKLLGQVRRWPLGVDWVVTAALLNVALQLQAKDLPVVVNSKQIHKKWLGLWYDNILLYGLHIL